MTDVQQSASYEELTAYDAGIAGMEQIRIALRMMRQQSDKSITMQQVYDRVEQEMKRINPTYRLSKQGRATLRYLVNSVAVNSGYARPNEDYSEWHITKDGEIFLDL